MTDALAALRTAVREAEAALAAVETDPEASLGDAMTAAGEVTAARMRADDAERQLPAARELREAAGAEALAGLFTPDAAADA
ncbi:hypothetical protein [Promicromonospora sp. NFX87]|uniref:hypothetical protein n=1 Tax=Promicromonospora sp. NFX87 TaxID=3402691 RepID=UPI003AFB3AC0